MSNKPNIELLARVLSEILSDKHGVDVTIEAVPIVREDGKAGASA